MEAERQRVGSHCDGLAAAPRVSAPRPPSIPRLHRGVVFVVDDEDAFRQSVEDLLEDAGFLVLNARSGAEALCRMKGISQRAVAIVDLNMPDMNGWELIERMQADSAMRQIPVLVLTGEKQPEVPGVYGVLAKTADVKKVLSAVELICPD